MEMTPSESPSRPAASTALRANWVIIASPWNRSLDRLSAPTPISASGRSHSTASSTEVAQ